jgi:hypothetical protein
MEPSLVADQTGLIPDLGENFGVQGRAGSGSAPLAGVPGRGAVVVACGLKALLE